MGPHTPTWTATNVQNKEMVNKYECFINFEFVFDKSTKCKQNCKKTQAQGKHREKHKKPLLVKTLPTFTQNTFYFPAKIALPLGLFQNLSSGGASIFSKHPLPVCG